MRSRGLILLFLLLGLNGSLAGDEPTGTGPQNPELRSVHRRSANSVASPADWAARVLAADDSTGKCAAACQEKRDACFGQCKTTDNPKICQGACLDSYKSCRNACGS